MYIIRNFTKELYIFNGQENCFVLQGIRSQEEQSSRTGKIIHGHDSEEGITGENNSLLLPNLSCININNHLTWFSIDRRRAENANSVKKRLSAQPQNQYTNGDQNGKDKRCQGQMSFAGILLCRRTLAGQNCNVILLSRRQFV